MNVFNSNSWKSINPSTLQQKNIVHACSLKQLETSNMETVTLLDDCMNTSLPPIPFIVCQQSIWNMNSFSETLSNSELLLRIPVYSHTGAPEGMKSQDLTAHPFFSVRYTCLKEIFFTKKRIYWKEICFLYRYNTSSRYFNPRCDIRLMHFGPHLHLGPHSNTTSFGSINLKK